VSVVCCQVEVSADHSSRGVLPSVVCFECDLETLTVRRRGPTGGCRAMQKKQCYGQFCAQMFRVVSDLDAEQ